MMRTVCEAPSAGVSAHQPLCHTGGGGPHRNAVGMELQMPPVSPIPFDNVHIQLGPKVLVLVS